MTDVIEKYGLTPSMVALLAATRPGHPVERGPDRQTLMRRGLVHSLQAGLADVGKLTALGREVRSAVLVGPAAIAEIKRHRLTGQMERALLLADPEQGHVQAGPTRAALMRRELVHRFGSGSGGTLTAEGWAVRALLIKLGRRS